MMTNDKEIFELDAMLENLHRHLVQELERQEAVLAICRAQGKAALSGDAESLHDLTQSLVSLIQETMDEESKRHELLRGLVDALDLTDEEHTLTGLIGRVPENWQGRLREFQTRIREVLAETRETTKLNRRYFHHSSRIVSESITESVGSKPGYTSHGSMPGLSSLQAMLLNAAG